ncbi:hypothetical protein SHKM778_93350 [Streptomyces sp. KM77-8]|uniref:ThiC-associated domain-containing protein n=1 Tax=Streptomyces haneummycinicus TaxID=3074435 RepID=A0AAT9I0J2_9ACTN
MTNKDARTPASTQNSDREETAEAGKSIGWHKAYVEGTRPDLRVPVRQVHLTNGQSVTLYDTSGPYTDPLVDTDVRRGLAPVRENWIIARGDTEEYAGRPVRPEDDGIKHTAPRGDCATWTPCSRAGRACHAGAGKAGRSHSWRTRAGARSRPRWSTWRSGRTSRPRWSGRRSRRAGRCCRPTSTTRRPNR